MIIKLLDKIFMDKNNQKYKIKFKKKMIILLYKKRKNYAMILIMIKFSLNKNNKKTIYLKDLAKTFKNKIFLIIFKTKIKLKIFKIYKLYKKKYKKSQQRFTNP